MDFGLIRNDHQERGQQLELLTKTQRRRMSSVDPQSVESLRRTWGRPLRLGRMKWSTNCYFATSGMSRSPKGVESLGPLMAGQDEMEH